MNINVFFKEKDSILYGIIEGEIDTYTAPILREELNALKITERLIIKVDLSKVSYMDSTGLGIFVAFYKKVAREHAELKLVNMTNRLVRLFEITGLSELMDIESEKKVELSNESI